MCNDCPNFRCIHFSAEESTAITTLYDILDGHCPSVRADIEINSNERNLRRTEYVRVNDRKMKITPEVALTQIRKLANTELGSFKNASCRSNLNNKTHVVREKRFLTFPMSHSIEKFKFRWSLVLIQYLQKRILGHFVAGQCIQHAAKYKQLQKHFTQILLDCIRIRPIPLLIVNIYTHSILDFVAPFVISCLQLWNQYHVSSFHN